MSISVYITSYNHKEFLIEAIDSVLAQTLRPSQIIIVDDCSSDGSQEAIAGYVSRFPDVVLAIYHSRNQGVAQTRIDALSAVTGDYVTYVDGDDRVMPTKLEQEMGVLKRTPSAAIIFSNHCCITADGVRTEVWANDNEKPPQGNVFAQTFARHFPKRRLFRNELVDYRAWAQIGFYDPNLPIFEDYDMRIRLTKHLRVAYCNEVLAEYRSRPGGLSQAKADVYLKVLEYIYAKNRGFLADLDSSQRAAVERDFCRWMARFAKEAIIQALRCDGNWIAKRRTAVGYCLKALQYGHSLPLSPRLAAEMILPDRLYCWLATCYRDYVAHNPHRGRL